MKRLLIGLGAAALAIWLGLVLLAGGHDAPHTDARLVAAQPPRQPVVVSGGRHEDAGFKRLSDGAEDRPGTKSASQLKFELMEAELAKRPELKAALRNNIRRVVVEANGDLEALLGVDRATANKLGGLLFERALMITDVVAVMQERGIGLDDPRYKTISRNLRQELDLELKAIAGEEKYELLKLAPQVQQRQVDLVTDYSAQFQKIGAPLSSDQSLQLAILMARFDVRDASAEASKADAGPGQYLRPRSDVPMLEAASKILTPAQLDVVRRRLIDQNQERDFRRQLEEEIYPANGLK